MNVAPHPLHEYLRKRGPTIEQAAEAFAREVSAEGSPVKPRTIRSIASGDRRPRSPLSEVIARLADIDELLLLKWRRRVPAALPTAGEAA